MSNSFKRLLTLTLGVLFTHFSIAQTEAIKDTSEDKVIGKTLPIVQLSYPSKIELKSDIEFGSNVFNRELMTTRINDEVIDDNFGRVSIFSRAGLWNNNSLTFTAYRRPLKDNNFFLIGGISSAVSGSMGVTEPLLKTSMRGNAQYAGQSVNFGGSEFLYQSFDRVTLGLAAKKGVDAEWRVKLHGIGGKTYYHAAFREAFITFSEFGDTISGPVRANWQYTDADQRYSGWGLGADFEFDAVLESGLRVEIGLHDVGFVSWNNAMINTVDDTLDFDGFAFELQRDAQNGVNFADSLTGEYVEEKRGSHLISLPTRFNVRVTNMIVPKHLLSLSLGTINIPGYVPRLEVTHTWVPYSDFFLSSSIGYGGFGQLRWREYAQFNFGHNHFVMGVGVMGIESLSYNGMAMNAGGTFLLSYKIF